MKIITTFNQNVNQIQLIFQVFLATLITIIVSYFMEFLIPTKAEIISENSANIIFQGNNQSPVEIGGEYIVFQLNNNIAKGLVYVQNSDVFSCFKGTYNQENKSIQQLIYSYPEMESDEWITSKSNDILYLKDFPYSFTYSANNESVDELFKECLNQF